MMPSLVGENVRLLLASVDPDIDRAFSHLVDLKRYEEVFVLFNRWQQPHLTKCIQSVKKIIDRFRSNVDAGRGDSAKDFISFLNASSILETQDALDAIFDYLFQPLDRPSYLDMVKIDRVDAFLAAKTGIENVVHGPYQSILNEGEIRALSLIARRKHLKRDFLSAANIYINLGCRQGNISSPVTLQERLNYLENLALTECLHLGSVKTTRDLEWRTELVKFQYQLLDVVSDIDDEVHQKLRQWIVSENELFEIITTHPILEQDLHLAEQLLAIIRKKGES